MQIKYNYIFTFHHNIFKHDNKLNLYIFPLHATKLFSHAMIKKSIVHDCIL